VPVQTFLALLHKGVHDYPLMGLLFDCDVRPTPMGSDSNSRLPAYQPKTWGNKHLCWPTAANRRSGRYQDAHDATGTRQILQYFFLDAVGVRGSRPLAPAIGPLYAASACGGECGPTDPMRARTAARRNAQLNLTAAADVRHWRSEHEEEERW